MEMEKFDRGFTGTFFLHGVKKVRIKGKELSNLWNIQEQPSNDVFDIEIEDGFGRHLGITCFRQNKEE